MEKTQIIIIFINKNRNFTILLICYTTGSETNGIFTKLVENTLKIIRSVQNVHFPAINFIKNKLFNIQIITMIKKIFLTN